MSSELWKQCADWLNRLSVLPPNHRIVWPDATIQDLAYTLRDGVLLCLVASRLHPASIDMRSVNQRPQMAQFLCLKNIRIFLNACTDAFGLRETDLFNPPMLYDYLDFARVLHTLSKLSNCPKARSAGVAEGFPQSSHSGAGAAGVGGAGDCPTHEEEQIYRTLEDMVNEEHYEEFSRRHHHHASVYGRISGNGLYYATGGRAGGAGGEETDEVIYEDLCSFKNSSSRRMQRELNFQPKEKRDYCIKELVETEGNYVDVLNMLRKHFIRTIATMKDADKKIVFMNIKDLGETHAAFYQDVLESVTGKSRKKIGEIFLDFKARFLKYGDYCSDLPRAQETLDLLLTKNESVREEVSKCEQHANEGKFRLRDLLAVPMQRILKYHLLLRELMSNTASTHDEYHTIQQAYEAMLDVSDYINEVKRDSEQLYIIREIQTSITDWNMPEGVELKDYGRLRKDSELKVQSHDSATGSKTKVRYVFVFDKVMLMCKASRGGDHYSYKDSLKISDYKVQDVTARRGGRGGGDSRWAYSFLLVHVRDLNAYTMFAKTEEDKNKWIGAIREALYNVMPTQSHNSTHEVRMFTFDKPSTCNYCNKLLKGMFYQGYRCDKCDRSMHKECISLMSKCGVAAAPSLPPRPPSMHLPVATRTNRFSRDSTIDDQSLVRQSSLLSIASSSLPPPLTPANVHNQPTLGGAHLNNSNPDYINTRMEDHSWFVGAMDRESANTRLLPFPEGTFLVRCRVQNGERVGYALSLKTTGDVKHMKICSAGAGCSPLFYLSDTRKFRSVVELITWFSRNSLKESFSGLDTLLRFSVGELSVVEALFDFVPGGDEGGGGGGNGGAGGGGEERNMLPLRTGERVTVIDKLGDSQGWWKALNAGLRAGFIPKDFVRSLDGDDAGASEEKGHQQAEAGEANAEATGEDLPEGNRKEEAPPTAATVSGEDTKATASEVETSEAKETTEEAVEPDAEA